ncbi:MAG: sigma-70 family RNA polymerase sigma factor [Chitinophagaceae bacterium]|nr:sigma-70 family RNA polymerase sigma factor [Chitinophagaceae bacterium]
MNTADQNIMLWESFRKGDKEAFAALFREHYGILYRFGNKFTTDTELLEDSIQELFIELWQAKSQAPVLSVKAYLLKSLKYKLLKAFRHNGKILPIHDNGDIPFELSHETLLISQQESDEKKRQVIRALERLSHRQKEIIYLKYYQNLSYEEVSEIMNINYQVARNLLYQAIKSLKNMLAGPMELFLFFLLTTGITFSLAGTPVCGQNCTFSPFLVQTIAPNLQHMGNRT